MLGPVADLTHLVGFRLIAPRGDADPKDVAAAWLDDEPRASAVALPPPETYT